MLQGLFCGEPNAVMTCRIQTVKYMVLKEGTLDNAMLLRKIFICTLQCCFFSSRTHCLLLLYIFLGNSFVPEVIPKLVSVLLFSMMLSWSLSWSRGYLKETFRLHTCCNHCLFQEKPFLSQLPTWCPPRRSVCLLNILHAALPLSWWKGEHRWQSCSIRDCKMVLSYWCRGLCGAALWMST